MSPTKNLLSLVRDVPDFPTPGVVFKDITPLLQNPDALRVSVDLLSEPFQGAGVDLVVGIESRGFIFGPAVALRLGAGFGLARKKGKLPWQTVSESYQLEYGSEEIEMHRDTVQQDQRVLLIDDVIATGGTAAATTRLVRSMGGKVLGASFLIELSFLEGRKALNGTEIRSVLTY
ncbi:MAG: adenine phosphoribosyltransferase [bacterium]|nr:adenine phosphoribosyltransferase [bacterium]